MKSRSISPDVVEDPNGVPADVLQRLAETRTLVRKNLDITLSQFPGELKSIPHWVTWRLEPRRNQSGDWNITKVLCVAQPDNPRRASSTNPKTWRSFSVALAVLKADWERKSGGFYDGIGFVLTNSGYSGVDFDHVLKNGSGLPPWAKKLILEHLHATYIELSIRGEGLHAFVRGGFTGGGIKEEFCDGSAFEMYCFGRYFVISGQAYNGAASVIADADAQALHDCFKWGGIGPDDFRARQAAKAQSRASAPKRIVDVLAFLKRYNVEVHGVPHKETSFIRYCVTCPGCGAKNAYLLQHADGGASMGCYHKTCSFSNTKDRWKEFKKHYEAKGGGGGEGSKNAHNVPAEDPDARTNSQKKSQATRLVELAFGQGVELFHDATSTAYASAPVREHRETWQTKSKAFRDFLAHHFYIAEARSPNSQALRDAIQTLDGQARFDGHEESVFVRVGGHRGKLYLDLGDVDWTAVEISADGWRLTKNPPVRFRRPAGLGALPVPLPGGHLDQLRPFLNLGDEDGFVLICAWLVAALRPRGPYPILYFVGEQGSAKSTTTRVLRRLIDPNRAELRTAPRDERDLLIAAGNGLVIALDNVSRLDPWLSDAMCRLATGGGLATRELYTDAEEVLFDAQRPQLLNGIEELGVRGDFLERSIIVTLRAILDGGRRDEETFWSEFESVQPRIIGAMLDAVAGALKNLNSVHPTEKPRMADFYRWSIAAESAMKFAPGTFARAYLLNRADSNQLVLEASPIASYLIALIGEHPEGLTITTRDLLLKLSERATESDKANSWPKSPRAVSAQLRRLAPTLRANGIVYTAPDRKTAARKLTLTKVEETSSSASATTGEALMPG